MSRFLYGLPVRVGGSWWRPRYRFLEGAAFELGHEGSGWIIEIPADHEFDLSAPAWIAWALPRKRMRRPAGLHDLARKHPEITLWFGDLLFPDACHAEGVREPLLTLCWWAVRTNNNRS